MCMGMGMEKRVGMRVGMGVEMGVVGISRRFGVMLSTLEEFWGA